MSLHIVTEILIRWHMPSKFQNLQFSGALKPKKLNHILQYVSQSQDKIIQRLQYCISMLNREQLCDNVITQDRKTQMFASDTADSKRQSKRSNMSKVLLKIFGNRVNHFMTVFGPWSTFNCQLNPHKSTRVICFFEIDFQNHIYLFRQKD